MGTGAGMYPLFIHDVNTKRIKTMSTYLMHIGQPHANLHNLVSDPHFSDRSSAEKVMPQEALKLIHENQRLEPGSFEKCRANVIGHIIGGALPLAITGLCAGAFYALYVTGAAYFIYSKAIAVIAPLAQSLFATITQNAANMAISGGTFVVAGVVLTRQPVYEAIGSFFASCFGSCCGTVAGAGIVGFFKNVHSVGYNWWYNKYQFTQREAKIKENTASALNILKNTYNDMADNLKQDLEKDKSNAENLKTLKSQAAKLHKQLPAIQHIFAKNGIADNEYEDISINLNKEIEAVVGYTPADDSSIL